MSAACGLLSLVQHLMDAAFYNKSRLILCTTSETFSLCKIFCVSGILSFSTAVRVPTVCSGLIHVVMYPVQTFST